MMRNDRIANRLSPGIVSGRSFRRASGLATRRFVTQSHVLSAPIARPRSLFVAATIAFALYLIGRRLSD